MTQRHRRYIRHIAVVLHTAQGQSGIRRSPELLSHLDGTEVLFAQVRRSAGSTADHLVSDRGEPCPATPAIKPLLDFASINRRESTQVL